MREARAVYQANNLKGKLNNWTSQMKSAFDGSGSSHRNNAQYDDEPGWCAECFTRMGERTFAFFMILFRLLVLINFVAGVCLCVIAGLGPGLAVWQIVLLAVVGGVSVLAGIAGLCGSWEKTRWLFCYIVIATVALVPSLGLTLALFINFDQTVAWFDKNVSKGTADESKLHDMFMVLRWVFLVIAAVQLTTIVMAAALQCCGGRRRDPYREFIDMEARRNVELRGGSARRQNSEYDAVRKRMQEKYGVGRTTVDSAAAVEVPVVTVDTTPETQSTAWRWFARK